MERVQPPKYTSTPRAERNTFTLLKNFIEVSPIFPTPSTRKNKSAIPVLTTNRVRSKNACSFVAKTTDSGSGDSAGQGSSGSVKIPSQIKKFGIDNKNVINIAQGQGSSGSVKTPSQTKKIGAENKNVINIAQGNLQNSGKKNPKKYLGVKTPEKVDMKCTTEVLLQVPKAQPKNVPLISDNQVSTKNVNQKKSLGPKGISEKESLSSVNKVIDSVVKSLSNIETKCSSQAVDAPDNSQRKSHQVSKISQRLSVLSSVPEEGLNEGTAQHAEDNILKKQISGASWLIPKETKTRISLKRKPSVLLSVTKRNKKSETNSNQCEESPFDNPELFNMPEVSLLHNKRQTYVLKKKCDTMADFKEEHHEYNSITDGIVPLQIHSQECSSSNKGMHGDLNNKTHETNTRKNIKKRDQTECKNKSEEINEDNENVNVNNYVSTDLKISKNKTKLSRQPDQSKENVDIALTVNNTESDVNMIAVVTNQTESTKKQCKKERNPSITANRFKECEVEVTDHQSKEIKNKNRKSKKKETNLQQSLDIESLKDKPLTRRTLRDRKQNIKYDDNSVIVEKVSKDGAVKKKKAIVKSIQDQKENLHELPLDLKLLGKKTVRESKKQSCANSIPVEMTLSHQEEVEISLKSKNRKSKKCVAKKEETISAPMKTSAGGKSPAKGKKKEPVTKRKKAEEKNEQNTHANRSEKDHSEHNEHCSQSGTSKSDIAGVSTSCTKRNSWLQKETSAIQNITNQTNEAHANSHNFEDLIGEEDLKLTSCKQIPSKPVKRNKTGSSTATETKMQHKSDLTNPTVKHTDDNPSVKLTEEDPVGNCKPAKENISNDFVQETVKPRKKMVSGKQEVKSRSRAKAKSDVYERSRDADVRRTQGTLAGKSPRDTPESENGTGKKRKSELMDCDASHSGSTTKRRRCDDLDSTKVTHTETRYNIKDLFGTNESKLQELQPGVMSYRAIHIHNFVMSGEVYFEPGAVLNKISTNTTYQVLEGVAQVRIGKHIKTFDANNKHRIFFIPRGIDVSITNIGGPPLKMAFSKFRG